MAITTVHGRQIREGSIAKTKIDASFQTYLDTFATSEELEAEMARIGSAFNYIGVLAGGATALAANDMAELLEGAKDAGDYYKVSVAGWFKVGAGTAFFANINDGLVWNTVGSVDIIDNTNSVVTGTTDFVTVTGDSDNGFTVDVSTTFKGRVTDLETAVGDVALLTTVAEDLAAAVNEHDAEIGDISLLATVAKSTLVAAINEVQAELENIDPSTRFVRDKVGATVTGVIDASNKSFVLATEATANTLAVYLNGVLQDPADDYAYTSATKTIAMVEAPLVGDKLAVTYFMK